jgi:hypothetical protein
MMDEKELITEELLLELKEQRLLIYFLEETKKQKRKTLKIIKCIKIQLKNMERMAH